MPALKSAIRTSTSNSPLTASAAAANPGTSLQVNVLNEELEGSRFAIEKVKNDLAR